MDLVRGSFRKRFEHQSQSGLRHSHPRPSLLCLVFPERDTPVCGATCAAHTVEPALIYLFPFRLYYYPPITDSRFWFSWYRDISSRSQQHRSSRSSPDSGTNVARIRRQRRISTGVFFDPIFEQVR